MDSITNVDGLDVSPGMTIRHPQGIVKVTAAARRQQGREIVNVVQVETKDGTRGYLTLKAGQTFSRIKKGAPE